MDKIINVYTRGTAQVGRFGGETRKARLTWFGHVRLLRMELPLKRKRGRPERVFMDAVREDMTVVEVT